MDNKVTILINSCDLYKSAWEPFLKLFLIQWPDCPYNFVINSETLDYHGEIKNVRAIHPDDKTLTWTQRFRYVLNHIESEYILFFIEDYFVLNPVNTKVFEHAVKVMEENPNVGMISLAATHKDNIKTDDYEDEDFYSRKIDEKNLIWCRTNLYRKDYLLKLLRDHETIWNFESYASYRAMDLPYIILQQNNNSPEVFTFSVKVEDGIGITLRKWLRGNVDLFKKYNIDVNFDELGFIDEVSPQPNSANNNRENPIRESLYKIKRGLRDIKKKIKKHDSINRSKK